MKILIKRRILAEHKYEISLPDGTITNLVQGTFITKTVIIAGGPGKPPIKDIKRLVQQYGGRDKDWRKYRGEGTVIINGVHCKVELHWYQLNKYRYAMKVKRPL